MNSAVIMDGAYSNHGNVIMKMIAKMALMRGIAPMLLVLMANSLVLIIDVFLCHK